MSKTYHQLSNQAAGITNEQQIGGNTKEEVGGLFHDIIEKMSDVDTNKQDKISDLDDIRSGAMAGANALQPVVGKGLSTNDYTDAEKAKVASISGKQDKITDLETIRSGAMAGAKALQPVAGKGLSTNDYTNSEKAKVASIDNKVDKQDGMCLINETIAELITYSEDDDEISIDSIGLLCNDEDRNGHNVGNELRDLKARETIVISRFDAFPSVGEYTYFPSVGKLFKGEQDEDGNPIKVEVALKDGNIYIWESKVLVKKGNKLVEQNKTIIANLVSEISYDQSNGEMQYCITRIVCEANEIRSTDSVRLARYISSKKVYVDDDYDKIIYRKKGWVTPDYQQTLVSDFNLYLDFVKTKGSNDYWEVSVGHSDAGEIVKQTLAEYEENRYRGDGSNNFANGYLSLAKKRCALYIERDGKRISEYMPFRVMYIDNWDKYIVTIAK